MGATLDVVVLLATVVVLPIVVVVDEVVEVDDVVPTDAIPPMFCGVKIDANTGVTVVPFPS